MNMSFLCALNDMSYLRRYLKYIGVMRITVALGLMPEVIFWMLLCALCPFCMYLCHLFLTLICC